MDGTFGQPKISQKGPVRAPRGFETESDVFKSTKSSIGQPPPSNKNFRKAFNPDLPSADSEGPSRRQPAGPLRKAAGSNNMRMSNSKGFDFDERDTVGAIPSRGA